MKYLAFIFVVLFAITASAQNKAMLYRDNGRLCLLTDDLSGTVSCPAHMDDYEGVLTTVISRSGATIKISVFDVYATYDLLQYPSGEMSLEIQLNGLDMKSSVFRFANYDEAVRAGRVRYVLQSTLRLIHQHFGIYDAAEIHDWFWPRHLTPAENAEISKLVRQLDDPAWAVRDAASRGLRKYRFYLDDEDDRLSDEQRNRISAIIGDFFIDGTDGLLWWASEL